MKEEKLILLDNLYLMKKINKNSYDKLYFNILNTKNKEIKKWE